VVVYFVDKCDAAKKEHSNTLLYLTLREYMVYGILKTLLIVIGIRFFDAIRFNTGNLIASKNLTPITSRATSSSK
jgi:hypothetical protein